MRVWDSLRRAQRRQDEEEPQAGDVGAAVLCQDLQKNLNILQAALGQTEDMKVHSFRFGPEDSLSGALVFIDGLADTSMQIHAILRPLMDWRGAPPQPSELMDTLSQEALCAAGVTSQKEVQELAAGCLSGDTVLLVDGCADGLVINTKGWEKRNISEPQSETVVRGPREGFTENLRTNTTLIRRKIRNSQLHVEQLTVGRKTRTSVCLMYLRGVANPKVVETVRYRISNLDVESVLETGYIEEYIEDAPFSPFATVGYTEKPDVVAAKILEGRVAIVVDGTPFVLTAPFLFIENFQVAEDYYSRPLYASMIRMLRYAAYLITVFAPAVYVALTAFHHELIPTTLLFNIAKAREGTPFPVIVEALIMIFSYEVLREAGVRLPRAVGQAISIVGALIMGEAAVNAGIVGPHMVITMAITAVSGFLVPPLNDSSSMLRVVMTLMACTLGFYGIGMGFLALLVHLATLKSFGITFFDSFELAVDAQDSLVRMPLWAMVKRPRGIARGDTTRGRFFIPPLRPYAADGDEPEGDGS